ncbi:MAG: hypothetical protein AAGF26_03330 [Cyanobacteria bacterium P01_G01_bin.49]
MSDHVLNPLERLVRRWQRQDLHHTVGRFRYVRQLYSLSQNRVQNKNPIAYKDQLNPRDYSIFPDLSVEQCVTELKREGVSFNIQLLPELVDQIYQFACMNLCREPHFDREFMAEDVQQGQLPCGHHVLRGLVQNPEHCPAIEQVAQDPNLLQIARNYLNYWPTKVTRHLTWAFVSDLPVGEQKYRFLPYSYHYDVAGYNFMTAYFYITDMDTQSGAHVMMPRSHNQKPLHTLFAHRSGRQPDQVIHHYYGKENEIVIAAKAGFGFVQDPSCFHKLLPPVTARRLIFQVRYA